MAMSKTIRKELGKARELLWWFLSTPKPSNRCFFCKGILLTDEQKETLIEGFVRFGNAAAPPLLLEITLHHLDGNHDNNKPVNLTPAHESCHKKFHARLVFAKINGIKRSVEQVVRELRRAA